MPPEVLTEASTLILFRVGILMAASLWCATMAALAARESRPSTTGRLLPWLLGVGAVWYLLLPLQHLLFPYLVTTRIQPLIPPTGLLRPGLLLFMAGLVHCYLSEIPPDQRRKPWFSLWVVYAPTFTTFFLIVVLRLGAFSMPSRPVFWAATEPFVSVLCLCVLFFDLAILLVCYWKLTRHTNRSMVWFSVFLVEAVLIGVTFLRQPGNLSGAGGYYDLLSLLLPVPLAIWPAYTRARFRFFDILIKRGLSVLVMGLLMAGELTVFFWLLSKVVQAYPAPQSVSGSSAAGILLLSGLIALFLLPAVALFLALRIRLDLWVDQILLKRPDYAREFSELLGKLHQATDEAVAIQTVAESLTRIMQAETVDFLGPGKLPVLDPLPSTLPDALPQLRAVVASGHKTYGVLQVVGGTQGLRYLSQDLNFLERVAGQLAGTLLALHTQEERTAQLRQAQKLKELAAQAHVRALQAQMNPHFLFNCLNLLNTLVRIDPERARKVMQCLAAVFRYTLDSTERETVTLGEELRFVENYLEIAQARFGARLSVSIEVPKEFHSVTVLPMLLQPLVENALHHGIEPKVGHGRLQVTATADEGYLCLQIADDGVGFTPSDAQPPTPNIQDTHAGIGLRNVAERLRARYGASYAVRSAPNQGTTVELRIPLEMKGVTDAGCDCG